MIAIPAADEGRAVDVLMAGYAAGSLNRPLKALVEAHLVLSAENRDFVASLETLGAGLVEGEEPQPLSDRDGCLAAVFGTATAAETAMPGDAVMPAPLAAFLGRDLDSIRWKTVMPGLREHRVSDEASLLWITAGRKMPTHTHHGTEVTLVLKGGFSDETGHYGRGDIAIGDEDLDHSPVADADEDCLCFVVNDGPLRLTGPIGRWIEFLRLR